MLHLFFPARRPSALVRSSAPVRARLGFEELGGRLAPSDLIGNDDPNNGMPHYVTAPPTAVSLQIVDFQVIENGTGVFELRGRVLNAPPGTTVLVEAAHAGLDGRVLTVNEDGEFSTSFTVTDGSAGNVAVTATDADGNTSGTVFGEISPTIGGGG